MAENKRTAAYEDIFGRPSAQHHRSASAIRPSAPLQYSSQVHRPQYSNGGQHNYYPQSAYQQQYYAPQNLSSHGSSVSSSLNAAAYPQAYPNSHHQPYTQPTAYSNQLAPPQEYPPALSVTSAQGVIAAQPEQPPDASLEALTPQSLTPAQAYQAQVYLNNPAGQQSNWTPYRAASPGSSVQPVPSASPTNIQTQPIDADSMLPRIEDEDGYLGVELGGDSDSASSLPYMSPPSKPVPLHLDTAASATSTPPVTSVSPSSMTHGDVVSPSSPRRSSESVPSLPRPKGARPRTVGDRSKSMSATPSQVKSVVNTLRNSHQAAPSSPTAVSHAGGHRRTPIVYPALLSRVAEAFRVRVNTAERIKDGLTYKDAFDGREAVDKIAYIIKTTDRCLALLLGRALDAQKFFHDVTYDHRLRDSANELYQFRTRLSSPFVSGEDVATGQKANGEARRSQATITRDSAAESTVESTLVDDSSTLVDGHGTRPPDADAGDEDELPSGVFTLLTDCYSPTCTRDRLCYSIACPRRLEQQSRLNLKQEPGLKRSISRESLGDLVEPGTLWVHSVPQEVVDSVSETEKKRQEAINEVIYTERDFVRDMEYLRDVWIKPLQSSDVIPEERRQDFLSQVFWNINDIISVNVRLRDALNKRQKSYAVVEKIGDILLDAVPHFGPFVNYGSHQLYGKYEFEKEKNSNPAFAQFVEETERLPESRKLELNGYLTKPTTRLARYPLLLEVVLKYTPDDNPDKTAIPQAIKIVREFLGKVNVESGKTENRFNLLQLDGQIVFRPGESVDLRLKEEGRELLYKGTLKKRGGTQSESGDLQVFLFDHALLMVKQKTKHEQHKVYRRPIPLELLVIAAQDDTTVTRPSTHRGKNSLMKGNSIARAAPAAVVPPPAKGDSKNGYPITFVHLGRNGYNVTLWASTWVARKKWVENIQKQQDRMRERSMIFDTITLSEGFFNGINKVNCVAPFSGGRRVAYGTDDGVYFSDLREPNREPMKMVALVDVAQLDVLDEYQLLIVLSERAVITFPLDALDPRDPLAGLKRAKRVSAHTSFFKAGTCLGKTLVCVVKTSPLSSTIKALEPIDYSARGKNKPTFRKLLQGGNDTLRPFKEFYIPVESNSIHFLKTKLCVGCVKGFEIVDLETLDTQGLLDPDDVSLDFVQKREVVRPMAIYRIEADFLLCYDEFAFYVNRNGWRTRSQFMVHWEGLPTAFALHYPYVLAFEQSFVEIRHVETGQLAQIIQGNNLRCLFADTPPSNSNTPQSSHLPHNPYGMSPQPYGARNSGYSQYGAPQYSPAPSYGRSGYSSGRDEIIMVSDDSVMALRLAAPPTDPASMISR